MLNYAMRAWLLMMSIDSLVKQEFGEFRSYRLLRLLNLWRPALQCESAVNTRTGFDLSKKSCVELLPASPAQGWTGQLFFFAIGEMRTVGTHAHQS
jgi:hypothetical protein